MQIYLYISVCIKSNRRRSQEEQDEDDRRIAGPTSRPRAAHSRPGSSPRPASLIAGMFVMLSRMVMFGRRRKALFFCSVH